jgi:molecular chaperone DnaK (HSP70)
VLVDKKVSGERNVLFFDLSGGAFDVSPLAIEAEVKATEVILTWAN